MQVNFVLVLCWNRKSIVSGNLLSISQKGLVRLRGIIVRLIGNLWLLGKHLNVGDSF